MNFRKGRHREDPEINLIPFIDVLLVILIFLMVTTTYNKFTALNITLPVADTEERLDRPFEIYVTVDDQNQYAINKVRTHYTDPAGLAEDLRAVSEGKGQQKREPVVVIGAASTATHQSVINVLEAARLAGLSQVTFAAQARPKK